LCFGNDSSEDAQHKFALLARFEGGWNDEILAGRDTEATGHLSQIDERRTATNAFCPREEIWLLFS